MRLLAACLVLIGAGAMFMWFMVSVGAGLCETDCRDPTVPQAICIVTAALAWIGAAVVWGSRDRW